MKPENSSNSSASSGNTIEDARVIEGVTASKKKKQVSASKGWCFTFHNYTKKDIETINSSNSSNYLIFSEETGKAGVSPHLQGYIEFKSKNRPTSLKWDKTIHWEKAKGSKAQNIAYIRKEGGTLYVNGKMEWPLEILKKEDLWIWEISLIEILQQKPNDRNIFWYCEGKGGSGKSTFVRYCCKELGAITLSGKGADMKYAITEYFENLGTYPSVILIDMPRNVDLKFLSYTAIEEIKNGCFFAGKFKSKQVLMPHPHVVIFSNEFPDIEQLSKDRWIIYYINKYTDCVKPDENTKMDLYSPYKRNIVWKLLNGDMSKYPDIVQEGIDNQHEWEMEQLRLKGLVNPMAENPAEKLYLDFS